MESQPPQDAEIRITLNGAPHVLERPLSVAELVATLELSSAQVAVEVDQAIVRRADHATRTLAGGEVVEVVTLVGGG